MAWLEVSLTVNSELAEAVADVLARFAPHGVTTEQAVRYNDAEDEGTPVGPVTVRAYLPMDDHLEETRQKLAEALFYLGSIQPLPDPVFTPIADQDWMEAWKEHYQPIPIGKRLIIVPAWLESPDSTRLSLKMDPGMAFGTGTHPTTQLCLEFLEELLTPDMLNLGPKSVIDIGCGSGILSLAALKLGATFALGVDIDPAAVAASRQNAAQNGIPETAFFVGEGSVSEVRQGRFPIQRAPFVLANILAPTLVRLFGDGLAELIEPDGWIILSGILVEQEESVVQAALAQGLTFRHRKQKEDWVALLFQR
ncbi:MAG: 50S ribosomal protein L11 methyltransferase [Anaerolineales bacterium]|nr:50S ribosomal protein L11 methyltransferase [Anaerolineales bacterium]MCX7609170.1 50S ribosomal protein L11 methyltransferase [Anaerolineales bacterium]MDW8227604.1 50S ribosomal protein L11 methyltransferase [Anaerolineales bacterium]